jgi:general stress protein 26
MTPQANPPCVPAASRPYMPEYGILEPQEGQGLLPWSWAVERLSRSHNYWLATTKPDGRPHLMAVWGIFLEGAFYFSTGRRTRKAHNLASNAFCTVCTQSAEEAVILEGVATLIHGSSAQKRINDIYQVKYGQAFPGDSNVYAVIPKVAFGFIEGEAEFAGSATRWHFSADDELPLT